MVAGPGYGAALWSKVSPSGSRGFSWPVCLDSFLSQSRGGGLSPTGQVFLFIIEQIEEPIPLILVRPYHKSVR